MSLSTEWPPSPEAMHSLLPAFEFTAMVTSSDVGAVFFANQKSLERQVALKVFSPALAADADFRKAFEKSSKLTAGLRHANLIGILDSGEVGGMPYLVMEFVPGKSLARSTKGHIVEFGQSLSIIDAICEGLAHAHDAGLVHGHLDNLSILLNQNALPKIGNFGLGRAVHTDPQVEVPVHFTAPEVLADPSAATKASDVYSAAALFHGLITGKRFSPMAPPPSSVCGCSPVVDSVLKRATDPDPLKRYADARAFQAALKQAIAKAAAPAAAPASAPPPAAPLPKAGSDSKLLVKIAVIIVLLIAIKFTWDLQKKVRADRERENREVVAKQKLAKEQAAALVAEMEALENAKRPTVIPDHRPVENKVEESPADSLGRLRSELADGKRSEMPVGSVKKGDRTYFLVEEEMQWAEAARFAEEHGAYLADPSQDLGWLDAELTKGRKCWLGAARGDGESWVLSDGRPWSPSVQPEGDGLFLVAERSGEFGSDDASDSRPFVIEWRDDGSNPGSLANLLAATRESLGGATPVYPPGTVVSGERRYLFINRPMTWNEAVDLAKSGGGHLLVAATSEEIAEVAKLTNRTKAKGGIWLGGSLEDDLWQWVTGEPWQTAVWADDSDATEEGVALALRPRDGWVAMDRGEIADGLLIEWSADEKAEKPASTAPAGNAKVAELDAKVKELILAAVKKREDEHATNIKRLHWDIDSYLRNLSGTDRDRFGSSVAAIKEQVNENRLEIDKLQQMAENREIIASMAMLKLVNYHCEKQVQIDTQAEAAIGKIRDAYVTKVTAIRDEAKAAGQMKVAADIEEIIGDAADLDSWAESFGAERE
jgi:serine/threonine protein kinase